MAVMMLLRTCIWKPGCDACLWIDGSGFQLLIVTLPGNSSSFYTLVFLLPLLLSLCLSRAASLLASLACLRFSPTVQFKLLLCCGNLSNKIHRRPPVYVLTASSAVNGVPWSSEGPRRNSHTFNCRMLVNPRSESQDEAHEHEPQQQKYETMQCFAVSEPKSIKEEGDGKQQWMKDTQ